MSTLAQMISSAFPDRAGSLCAPDEVPVARKGHRRKLWELPHAFHCALIGTCLPVAEMRRPLPCSGYDISNMSGDSPHAVVVGQSPGVGSFARSLSALVSERPVERRPIRVAPV